jgi:hypothetical protein
LLERWASGELRGCQSLRCESGCQLGLGYLLGGFALSLRDTSGMRAPHQTHADKKDGQEEHECRESRDDLFSHIRKDVRQK